MRRSDGFHLDSHRLRCRSNQHPAVRDRTLTVLKTRAKMTLLRLIQNGFRTALQELLTTSETMVKIIKKRSEQSLKKCTGYRIRSLFH